MNYNETLEFAGMAGTFKANLAFARIREHSTNEVIKNGLSANKNMTDFALKSTQENFDFIKKLEADFEELINFVYNGTTIL